MFGSTINFNNELIYSVCNVEVINIIADFGLDPNNKLYIEILNTKPYQQILELQVQKT